MHSRLEGDEGVHRLTGELVSSTDDRRLGDARVRDERGLDLRRGQTVAGDIDNIYTTRARTQSAQEPRARTRGGRHAPSTRPLIQM